MMRTFRMMNVPTFAAAAAFVCSTVSPAFAQQQAAATASPAPVQTQTVDRYTVGQARPPIVEGSQLIELTLEQAQAIAIEKNLNLKVQRMNPQGIDYQIAGARATFNPAFNLDYSYRDSQSQSNNTTEGVLTLTSRNQGYNGRINQTLPWYGATYSVSFSNNRQATNNASTRVNPAFNTGMTLNYSMPLLNGFKIDGNRNQLRTLQVQRVITDINLLASVENTKNQVRQSYWNLRQAIEQIEIARRALDIAKKQLEDSLLKVEIGTLAPIETTNFEVAVANNAQGVLAAEIGWRTAELNFKSLIVSGTDDDLYRMTINPTDKPELGVASVDIQAAVSRALAERTDIVVSRRNLDVSRLNLEVTKGSLKPTLNLNGGYSVTGQGGTTRLNDGTIVDGGYWDALRAAYGFALPTWNFGFTFNYPLGMRAAKANYARSVLTIDQSVAQLKAQELTISTAVINAGLAVENSYKLYQAAVKSREAAEKNADASQVRFDNGMLTNFEVVQNQQTLTASRLSELNRLISYMNAVAEFERVQKVGG
jgi:outer membrane protein TolC